jgi:hypothetical protein
MTYLYRDGEPKTLAILAALLGQRPDHHGLGYSPDERGAQVDWELLTTGRLSAAERATIQLARGCFLMERNGDGVPSIARPEVRAAIDTIAGPLAG